LQLNEYTDARSRPGQKLNTGTDDRQMFLVEFGDLVLQAWEETNNYENLTFTKNITQGKADTFPIIGRKRDAQEHNPGDIILGGRMEHNEVEVTLDRMLVDSAFVAEVDELMNHYNVMEPYARQLGESLSTSYDRRVAIMHILASRVTVRPYEDGPVPNGYFHANVATDPAHLENAAYAAVEFIRRFDVGGGPLSFRMPHQQHLLLARYAPVKSDNERGNSIVTGQAGNIGGLRPEGTNHIPRTNITTGLAKYQGDFTSTVGHISNRMAVATLARRGLKVVMKDQADRLGTLLIASKFNGHGILRAECSFEIGTSDITGVRGANHPDVNV
jgi:hypothetical protein